MKDIDAASQPNSVDGAVCVTVVTLDDLQNSCAAESLEWFRISMLATLLGYIDKVERSALALPIQTTGLMLGEAAIINIMPERA